MKRVPGHPLDQPGQRLQRQLEALLVDQPAHQQHQLLVGLGEAGPQRGEVVDGHQLGRVDPVGHHRHAVLLEAVDVGHVLAHVGRAGDQLLAAVGHPALDPVDVGLRVAVHPALVAAVLGGVDRDHQRAAEALGEVVPRRGHEPVVSVHEVEVVAVAHLDARGQHVGVHVLDPGHELAQLARALGLAHAVHQHAVHLLLAGRLLEAAGQHVHLHAARRQALRQLAHVAGQAALDQRRVLPGQQQDAHLYGVSRGARSRSGARLRRAGSRHAIGVFQTAQTPRRERRGARPCAAAGSRPPGRWSPGRPSRWTAAPAARARRAPARPAGRRPSARTVPRRPRCAARRRAPRRRSRPRRGDPRWRSPCRRPSWTRGGRARTGGTRSTPSSSVTRSRPWEAASSNTASSQICPSYHQWPSSSVSSAKVSRPARPRSARWRSRRSMQRATKSRACSRASAAACAGS